MGMFGAVWGLIGVFLLIGGAVFRLGPLAVDSFSYDWSWYHWTSLVLFCFFMLYTEGYRGFQKGFSPRVAARALYLRSHPDMLHLVFAPLFCMAFFHATRRRRLVSISLTSGIITLVLLVRLVPQPWRGIIDAGVVLGLVWGLLSLTIFSYQALVSGRFDHSPEVPDEKD
jgi:hypothetical protein